MDAASNWDDRWSAGYLTTQSCLNTIFPTSSDQKAVMMECAADVVTGEGVWKQFQYFCQRMGEVSC